MNTKTLALSWNDPKTQRALATGWLHDPAMTPSSKRVIARKILNEDLPLLEQAVLFEWIEPGQTSSPRSLSQGLQAIRAFSLTATATPCLAILALGWSSQAHLRGWVAACSLFGVLFFPILNFFMIAV